MTKFPTSLPLIETAYHAIELHAWGARTYLTWSRADKGAYCDAVPGDDSHYTVITARLGYRDDTYRYCWEHELAHVVIAEKLQNAPSLVLRKLMGVAKEVSRYDITCEEVLAQLLQRFVNTNEEPIVSDVDWDGLGNMFKVYRSKIIRYDTI